MGKIKDCLEDVRIYMMIALKEDDGIKEEVYETIREGYHEQISDDVDDYISEQTNELKHAKTLDEMIEIYTGLNGSMDKEEIIEALIKEFGKEKIVALLV